MSESDISEVLAATKFETFSGETVICSQGDLALKFYIVVSGTCSVLVRQLAPSILLGEADPSCVTDTTKTTGGLEFEVARINPLQYFGEGCLEQVTKDRRRIATVKASSEGVTLLSLHRDDLLKLIEQGVIRCKVLSSLRQSIRQRSRANLQRLQMAGRGRGMPQNQAKPS